MTSIPVIVDRWEIACCRKQFSLGDHVSWRLEFVPVESATVPGNLLVKLDASVETITVLQPPEYPAERTGHHYQFLHAGPIHAAWTAPQPYAGPTPLHGALIAGWHGGGVQPPIPWTHGVINRIRVLRQTIVLQSPRLLPVPEGAQMREVTTSPLEFTTSEVQDGAPGHWEEIGIVVDIDVLETR